MIGTWRETNDHTAFKINGKPVVFASHGATQTLEANGTAVVDFGNGTVFTATKLINGVRLTAIVKGRGTQHYKTASGEISGTDPVLHGTAALYENGVYAETVPISFGQAQDRYTCSGSTLAETATDGSATVVLARVRPSA